MTPQQARERFDDALDGELSEQERQAFERALQADDELREEYEAHCATGAALGALSEQPSVDLLPDLQARLRAQSGGKYYRDRFSEKQGSTSTSLWIVGCVALVVIAVLWLANEAGLLLPQTPQ